MTRMTPTEAVALCRFAKACCPQQAFDEYTPDAWFELLKDLRMEDCKTALTIVVRSQPFVSPAEIRDEVKRLRWGRISAFGVLPDPPDVSYPDDPARYSQWHRELMQRIADGDLTSLEQYEEEIGRELVAREMPEIEGVFRDVDE